jgi:hypothetical protein
MSINWGGKQNRVRDNEIKDVAGYLGSYSLELQVGDVQKMVFTVYTINQELYQYDEVKGTKVKK